MPAHAHRARLRIEKAHEQLRRRRLARARRSNQRDGSARGHDEARGVEGEAAVGEVREVDAVELERDAADGNGRRRPRAVLDGDLLIVHGIETARCAEGVGELAADVRDLRDRQERRHGEQREQRQQRRIEAARDHELGARHHHGETAEAGGDLEQSGLHGEIAEKRHAHRERAVDALEHL